MNSTHLEEGQQSAIRLAVPSDAEQVHACVVAAYQHYIERIGKPPGPMFDDYAQIIAEHSVWVAEGAAALIGVVVLMEKATGILLDNIAVNPNNQGQGWGKRLMAFAEAEALRRGYGEISLYTHVKMDENIQIYGKLGYIETERRVEYGYERIYMKKQLSSVSIT